MREIAAKAGVSTATVSRVLSDSAGVSPETRAIVLQTVEQHRFTRRQKRRREPQARGVVAVRCPYVLTDYFGVIVSAVARSLRQHGKHVLFSDEYDDETEPSLPDLLLADMTEGAILVLPPEPPALFGVLRARNYPLVVIDPKAWLPADVAAVSAANMAGARLATEHLIQLGHRRIATISGHFNRRLLGGRETASLSGDARLMGFRAALAETRLLPPDEFIRFGEEPDVENGYQAACSLLDLPDPPTAIFAYNDKMAVGTLQAAAERGISVPRDLSIVGFDGLELSESVVPRLTTVRQPLEEMARMGVELLIRLIDGREIDTLHVELATELVLGASTAPPR
jgi:LacI family transcriptional regulator